MPFIEISKYPAGSAGNALAAPVVAVVDVDAPVINGSFIETAPPLGFIAIV